MKKRNVIGFGMSLLVAVVLAGCSGLVKPLTKDVINFDESRITCRLATASASGPGGGQEIRSGTSIAENTALYFEAKPAEGKMVSAWKVNDKKMAETETFFYYPNSKDLKKLKAYNKARIITVTFDEKDAAKITLTFPEDVCAYREVKDKSGREYEGN